MADSPKALKSAQTQLNFSAVKSAYSEEAWEKLTKDVSARGFNITYGEENADLIVTDLTMEALKRVKGLCLTFKNTGKIRYVNAVDLSGVGVNYVVGLLNPNKDDFPQFTVQKVTPEIVRAGLNSLVEVTLLNVELSGLTSKEAICHTVTDHFRTKMGFEIIDGTMSYDDKVNKLTFSLPSLFAGAMKCPNSAVPPSISASSPSDTNVGRTAGMSTTLDTSGKTTNDFGIDTSNLTKKDKTQVEEDVKQPGMDKVPVPDSNRVVLLEVLKAKYYRPGDTKWESSMVGNLKVYGHGQLVIRDPSTKNVVFNAKLVEGSNIEMLKPNFVRFTAVDTNAQDKGVQIFVIQVKADRVDKLHEVMEEVV